MKTMQRKMNVGEWVEVRSKEEILKTLDRKGQLEGTPFMPEMFRYCGQRFQVYKRAHKTCDYTTSYPYHVRRLEATVHLETRCDGEAHGGCQAGCLLYWKQAWLKPVSGDPRRVAALITTTPLGKDVDAASGTGCSESEVWANTLASFIYSIYYHLSQAGIGLGPAMRWFYNKFHPVLGGTLFPRKPGLIPEGTPTPSGTLNLQPGELVRVKSHEEILKTVDSGNKNRGMYWDAELVPYCGGTYRVLKSVTKIIDEKTGKMLEMKNPCIILDSVVCQARYSQCRMLCPKEMYPYWREIWLERVAAKSGAASGEDASKMMSVSSSRY